MDATKSPSDNRPSPLEQQADAQFVIPTSASGFLASLSAISDSRDASQDEIASLLRDADSLASDADHSQSTRRGIQSTESAYEAKAPPLPTEVPATPAQPLQQVRENPIPAPSPIDLTGVFRMLPAMEMNGALSKAGVSEEHVPMHSTHPEHSPYREAKSSVQVEETAGFTKIFQSLSAPPISGAATDSGKVGASEPSLPMEWLEEAPKSMSTFASPIKGDKSAQLNQHPDQDGGWGESRIKRDLYATSAAPQMRGGFTQLLRTLSEDLDESSPEHVMPESAVRIARDSNGPGEFTRIISDSMLREAQGRTPPPEAIPKLLAAAPNEVPVQGVSADAKIPEVAVPAATGNASSQSMELFQSRPSQRVSPQAVAVPHPGVPSAPTNAAPLSAYEKLQGYVPLLLIVNVFLMLLVLLALGVVIMRR